MSSSSDQNLNIEDDVAKKRLKAREKKREQRLMETTAQKICRKYKNMRNMKKSRESETIEQKNIRKEKDAAS